MIAKKGALKISEMFTKKKYSFKRVYRDIVESGFVERPTLNNVEKSLLGFLWCHPEQRLMMERHNFGAYERKNPRRQAVLQHCRVIELGIVIAQFDLCSQGTDHDLQSTTAFKYQEQIDNSRILTASISVIGKRSTRMEWSIWK